MVRHNLTDLELIKDRVQWPHWPYLPLKERKGSPPKCVVLYASDPYRLLDVGLFDITKENWKAIYEASKVVTPEEVIKDWMVD